MQLWDTATGAALLEPIRGHTNLVTSVVFSPDSISGSWDYTVRIWNAEACTAAAEPPVGHSSCVESITVSPDSSCIVSGSHDKSLRFWDFETALANHDLAVSQILFRTLKSAKVVG